MRWLNGRAPDPRRPWFRPTYRLLIGVRTRSFRARHALTRTVPLAQHPARVTAPYEVMARTALPRSSVVFTCQRADSRVQPPSDRLEHPDVPTSLWQYNSTIPRYYLTRFATAGCYPVRRMSSDELLTLAQISKELGIDASRLRRLAAKGVLRARKLGQTWVTTRKDVQAFVALDRPRGWPKGRPRPPA